MDDQMSLPPFYSVVRITAQIGAVLGCITGTIEIAGGLSAFQLGWLAGLTALSVGVYTILLSLAALGVAYGFLAIVEAQVDSRNALFDLADLYPRRPQARTTARVEPVIGTEMD